MKTRYISLIVTLFIAQITSIFAICDILPLPQKYEESNIRCATKNIKVIYQKVDKIAGVSDIAQDEAYTLRIKKNNALAVDAIISFTNEKGKYWAEQSLNQLKKKDLIFECNITDWPAYPIRGFMQDVGRSYIPLDELKQEIKILSQYKINLFHWHLTENLGWRMETKRYPELNDKKTFGRHHGKYYTFEEARELVKFCREHNMILLPEIDMPGHSAAFKKAFGKDMQSEEGMKILKDLVDEIITEAFPLKDNDVVPYFHIGTDEVHISNPKFIPEMVKFIRDRGKKVATWNPGANYKKGEIDLVQMWSARGKPLKGTPTLDSRLHYINHFDSFADPIAMYFSSLGEKSIADDTIAGGIIGVWHDRYVEKINDILAQNGFYPSLLFFAETAWTGGRTKYFKETGSNIAQLTKEELSKLKDFERRLMIVKKELQQKYLNLPFVYVPQADIIWRITEAFPNNGDLNKSFPPEQELKKEYTINGKTYKTEIARGAAIYLRHTWGGVGNARLVAVHYKQPKPNHTAYAYTWVYSPKAQQVGLWAQTQNYSRSENDLPPPQGKWDFRESKFWLNDTEIMPPIWINKHKVKNSEIPLKNENFEVRPPILLNLKEGWNKVLIKLPIKNFSSHQVRLEKWMFTFVFLSPDGKTPLYDLIYSPDKIK